MAISKGSLSSYFLTFPPSTKPSSRNKLPASPPHPSYSDGDDLSVHLVEQLGNVHVRPLRRLQVTSQASLKAPVLCVLSGTLQLSREATDPGSLRGQPRLFPWSIVPVLNFSRMAESLLGNSSNLCSTNQSPMAIIPSRCGKFLMPL